MNSQLRSIVSLGKVRRAIGFTLIELMITVAIVGILASIAYPSYIRQVQQSRQADAQGQVMELASAMEAYRAKNFSYQGATLADLAPSLNANKYYNSALALAADNQSFTITSTPKGMMAGTEKIQNDSDGSLKLVP